MKTQKKYYDISHLLRDYPDALYYMAIGERSNGKTYSALAYALERFYNHGEQFAYLRRFGEDVRPKYMQTLFSGHIQNGLIAKLSNGLHTTVDVRNGKFVPCRWDEEQEKLIRDDTPMGWTFDLNSDQHHKSTSYPLVTTIIFDEFLSRQGYLTNEFVLFMNVLSTIIRDRTNVNIFMIGNTVNKYSPYFTEMGLTHVKDQQAGQTDVYTYGDTTLKVVVEYCDPTSKHGGKGSDAYFAFDNPQLKMITSGSWEIAIYPHLREKYRPKDVVSTFYIEFDETLLTGKIIVTDTDYFLFIHPKTTPLKEEEEDIIYTNIPNARWNYRVGISNQNDKLSKTIRRLLNENRVFYSDNETGEVLRNYLIWSTQYAAAKGGR